MSKKDFYQVLGVSKSATADEIKKSYRKLAMQHHPDQNPGNKKSEEKFKELSEAYEILSDPEKRKNYDQFGSAEGNPFFNSSGGASGPGGFGGFGGGGMHGGRPGADPFADIFGDLFGSGFGGARPGRTSRAQQNTRGSDLRYTLTVTFEEVYTGCEKMVSFMRQVGAKEEAAKLSVAVPAGVKEGQRLKLAGEGDKPSGHAAGDLYVIINIQDHLLFKREENDVLLDFPISYANAMLGFDAEILTLSGKSQLKIPAGTRSDQILRLKGKGFPKLGGLSGPGSGDMLVRIVVDTPTKISSKEKEMLEALMKLNDETPLVKNYQEKVETVVKNRK